MKYLRAFFSVGAALECKAFESQDLPDDLVGGPRKPIRECQGSVSNPDWIDEKLHGCIAQLFVISLRHPGAHSFLVGDDEFV